MVRTPCCDTTGLKKGAWTAEEDRKLMAYITRYGSWNWRQLPKFAGDDDLAQNSKGQEKDTEETDVNTQPPANSAQIIESSSSTLSPQAPSIDLSITDNIAPANMDFISDDGFAFLEAYEFPGGNFWTEHFLSDDYSMPSDLMAPLVYPDSPCSFIIMEDYNLY
ncbi:hypothetical protein OIU76_023417 [Salix suchowensis]|nr:hypothetical protein OIU76_023417 [Salix suchowensis]